MKNESKVIYGRAFDQEVQRTIENAGMTVEFIPLIETKPVFDENTLLEISKHLNKRSLVVFTSQKAILAAKEMNLDLEDRNVACLEGASIDILKTNFPKSNLIATAKNAEDLTLSINEIDSIKSVIFLRGNLSLDKISLGLDRYKKSLKEFVIYYTELSYPKIDFDYGAVCFFSPSGIDSFLKNNKPKEDCYYLCIGNTTANYLLDFWQSNVLICDSPSNYEMTQLLINIYKE